MPMRPSGAAENHQATVDKCAYKQLCRRPL